VSYISVVGRIGDGGADTPVIQFLCIVHVGSPGISRGMEVTDPADVLTNRSNHVPLHDLHVINIVQQLDPGVRDTLTNGDAECCPVALISRMVNFRVQQLKIEVDPLLFRIGSNSTQPIGYELNSLFLAEPIPAVSAKANNTRNSTVGGNINCRTQFAFNPLVVRRFVQTILQSLVAAHAGYHQGMPVSSCDNLVKIFVAMPQFDGGIAD